MDSKDLGLKLADSQCQQACEEKAIFKVFLQENVFTDGTVILLPGGDADVSHRDEYSEFVDSLDCNLKRI
jgi:hypothetical protein